MKFLKPFLRNLLILIGLLIVLALANRWYLGGFTKLEAKEMTMWTYTIAYTHFVGEYGKVWPSMTKVYEALSGAGITSATGVGIYYDDPAVISWADLRSDVGAVIDTKDASKLAGNKDVKVTKLPAGTKVVIEFPLKNSVSYMIGPMRAYPVMAKYMKKMWYNTQVSMVELYDMVAKKIYYITDITK
jgi:hypothetical protein